MGHPALVAWAGAKARFIFCGLCGTTEVVPFPGVRCGIPLLAKGREKWGTRRFIARERKAGSLRQAQGRLSPGLAPGSE
jgi:hypothetical protein